MRSTHSECMLCFLKHIKQDRCSNLLQPQVYSIGLGQHILNMLLEEHGEKTPVKAESAAAVEV